jgi:hypothetical protein
MGSSEKYDSSFVSLLMGCTLCEKYMSCMFYLYLLIFVIFYREQKLYKTRM